MRNIPQKRSFWRKFAADQKLRFSSLLRPFTVDSVYLKARSARLSHCWVCSDVSILNQIDRVILYKVVNGHSKVFTEKIVGKFNLFLVGIIVPLNFQFCHVKLAHINVISDRRQHILLVFVEKLFGSVLFVFQAQFFKWNWTFSSSYFKFFCKKISQNS